MDSKPEKKRNIGKSKKNRWMEGCKMSIIWKSRIDEGQRCLEKNSEVGHGPVASDI